MTRVFSANVFKQKLFASLAVTIVVMAVFLFGNIFPARAMGIPCQVPDQALTCGITSSYNMSASCSMTGPDIVLGNRVLGGQVCGMGAGADNGGSYMAGSGQPNGSTPAISYGAGVTPGWAFNKSNIRSSIPVGEFADDSYYNIRFYTGNVTVGQPRADDESQLIVGSNYTYWTDCAGDIRDVTISSCPARTFMGNTSFNANPGDTVNFTVTNRLRPNNGSGTWGAGSANINLTQVTQCFTGAYKQYSNAHGSNYQDLRDYHPDPTVPGVCNPPPPTYACTMTLNETYKGNAQWQLDWNVSHGNSASITGIGSVGNLSSIIVGPGDYTLTAVADSNATPCVPQHQWLQTNAGPLNAEIDVLNSSLNLVDTNSINGYTGTQIHNVTVNGSSYYISKKSATPFSGFTSFNPALQENLGPYYSGASYSLTTSNNGTTFKSEPNSVADYITNWFGPLAFANVTDSVTATTNVSLNTPPNMTCNVSQQSINTGSQDLITANSGTAPYTFTAQAGDGNNWSGNTVSSVTPYAFMIYSTAGVKPGIIVTDSASHTATCPQINVSDVALPPTASLSANNQTGTITVNVGDSINYAWNSTNADTFSSNYTATGPGSCPGSGAWVASTASGINTATILPAQAGCTYAINYTARNNTLNQQITASVTVVVNTALSVTASCSLTASPNSGTGSVTGNLTWNTNNFSSTPTCNASGGWGGVKGASGTQSYGTLFSGNSFFLTCTAGTQTANCSASVNVTVTPPAPAVCGNGIREGAEACDLGGGNSNTCGGCSLACQSNPACQPVTCWVQPNPVAIGQSAQVFANGGRNQFYKFFALPFATPTSGYQTLWWLGGYLSTPLSFGNFYATVQDNQTGQVGQCSYSVTGLNGGFPDYVITDFHLTDASGNTKSSFASGEVIYPSVTIKNNGSGMPPGYTTNANFFTSIYKDRPNAVPYQTGGDIWIADTTMPTGGQSKTYNYSTGFWGGGNSFTNTNPVGSTIYTARAFVNSWGNFVIFVPALGLSMQDPALYESNGTNNQATATYILATPPPPSVSMLVQDGTAYNPTATHNPITVFYGNNSTTLTWSSSNASSCSMKDNGVAVGWAVPVNNAAGQNVAPSGLTGSHTYVITCTNSVGTATDTVNVTVPLPPTNVTGSCSPAGNFSLSWTRPSGYTLSYIRIYDKTSPSTVSSNGQQGYLYFGNEYAQTSWVGTATLNHTYGYWVYTEAPNGTWSIPVPVGGPPGSPNVVCTPIATPPPTIVVESPVANQTIGGIVPVAGYVVPAAGATITKIEFWTASNPVLEASSDNSTSSPPYRVGFYPIAHGAQGNTGFLYNYNSALLSDAAHTLTIKAYDNKGNIATQDVPVMVNNTPNGPTNVRGDNTTCAQISITWSPPASGGTPTSYNVYRYTGSSLPNGFNPKVSATKLANKTSPFNDTSLPTGSYFYWVTAVNISGESSPTAMIGNPMGSNVCRANLISSSKTIEAINDDSSMIAGHSLCNGTNALPSGTILNLKDKIKFSINLCNNTSVSGTGDATQITISDTLTNLQMPAGYNISHPTNPFNVCWSGTGSNCSGGTAITQGAGPGKYTISGSSPYLSSTLTINLNAPAFKVPSKAAGETGIRSITLEAELATPSNFAGNYPRFQNAYSGSYNDGNGGTPLVSAQTPLLLFNIGKSGPQVIEIP